MIIQKVMKDVFPYHPIERSSNAKIPHNNGIRVIKRHEYKIINGISITGDAPKALVRIYDYQNDSYIRKSKPCTWPMYIAKTGHKWYPIESLTEYLLNQLGQIFGLKMAESGIVQISGQIRFLSRYFLNYSCEELVHGADIFAGYVNDKDFVVDIEKEQLSRDLFTLQFVENSFESFFPFQKEELMSEFVRLLLFDALVGNNDRHFYNWGVIRRLDESNSPTFSPIYDTARGLFWNVSEDRLKWRHSLKNEEKKRYITKYANDSKPKIGWEGESNINHFKLVEKIYKNEFYLSKIQQKELFLHANFERMLLAIQRDFKKYFSNERICLISSLLEHRYSTIQNIISL